MPHSNPNTSRPFRCPILALPRSQAAQELLAEVGRLPGPTRREGSEPDAWQVTNQRWCPGTVHRVKVQKAAGDPFVVAVIDAAAGTDEQLEAIVSVLWDADPRLSVLILHDRDLILFDWHFEPWRMRERLALLKMPALAAEAGQLLKLMAEKWYREREIEKLRLQLGGTSANSQDTTVPTPASPAKGKPGTILVVDDDETIRLVVSQVLATTNHQILTAGNAEEAWHQWRQHRGAIKLVITDINMPGERDGVALGQVVQAEDASIPVIYTSGYRAASQFGHLKDGVNYLSKPFGMADLLKVVERNLAGVGDRGAQ